MKRTAILILLCAAIACTGNNKSVNSEAQASSRWPAVLFAGDYPDPSILVDGEDFYMTFTTTYWIPSLPIWHSRDLVNWELVGNALNKFIGTVWAPDFQKVDGRYYIYFPAGRRIYTVWADDVRGPWSEPVDMGLSAIDPGLGIGEYGGKVLYLNGGLMGHLTPDGLAFTDEPQKAYEPWPIPEDWEVEGVYLESPKIFKRDGWFYLISAEGGTAGPATSHMCVIHRSRSVEGPWESMPGNPLVHTWSADEQWWSKGHGTVFEDSKGQWWVLYHAYRNGFYTLGRHTLLDPIEWDKDGWPYVDSNSTRTLPGRTAKIEPVWMRWQGDDSILAAITGETVYTLSARIDVAPDATAGLLLSYSGKSFSGVTTDGKVFKIYHEGNLIKEENNPYGRKVWMKIRNHSNKVSLFAGTSGRKLRMIGDTLDVSGMHHNNLKGFMSLRPALTQSSPDCRITRVTLSSGLR